MPRKIGAKNVVPFEDRKDITTTSNCDIQHLADAPNQTHLETFKSLLDHQTAYLKWIDDRHENLKKAKKELAKDNKGPKEATYLKYRWYAAQQSLFESINAYEVFYKQTFISLAKAIRLYVPAERIKGTVDSKILWSVRGRFSIPTLMFEHQLFHDLDKVDETSASLVLKRRYVIGSANKTLKARIKALEAIFQIRHTLAHNQGVVTISDSAKFKIRGYKATANEVIDPTKDQLGAVVRKLLRQEADDFTAWLIDSTADYLEKCAKDEGAQLMKSACVRIERWLGTSAKLKGLPWIDS